MINNILNTLSNPRLDVLIFYKSKNDSLLVNNIFNFLKSKQLMCGIASPYRDDNSIYFKDLYNFNNLNDFNNEILFDLINKSYIILCINCDYKGDIFSHINKIVFNINKFTCNKIASQYLNNNITNKKYNLNTDLKIIYKSIIIKLFKKNYKIVAAISHMNEKTLNLCMDSMKKQSIPIENIKVFQGLTPMCNSFNACLDFACDEDADILLHTASDVVFEPWALKELLRIYNPKIHANVLSFGEDIILKKTNRSIYERAVCGIWIFNMNLFKNKQWRFQDEMKQDMKLFDRIKMNTGLIVGDNLNHYLNKGLDNCICPMFDIKYEQQSQGIHHPIWTLREIFDKYYYCLGKWKDNFKKELLQITNEFLKHNPNNNCLITIKYILTNIKTNTLKSKDSNQLENIYNNLIKKIPINTDSNNNFFVYHKKYINICNSLFNCKINIKAYDNIYNENRLFYTITKSQFNFSNAPFLWKYGNLPQYKRIMDTRFINHNYLNYINFLLANKFFFIQTKNKNNYLLDNKKLNFLYVIAKNRINNKNKSDSIYISILIYLYDINYILHNTTGNLKEKRVKYIKYILSRYKHEGVYDYNKIKSSLNKHYEKCKILKNNLSNFNTISNINYKHIIRSSLVINKQYVTEVKKFQNHFILLRKNINEIKINKQSLQERNIIFRIENTKINFDKEKLYTYKKIDNDKFNSIHFLNTENYYIFYFNLSTNIYMFLTNIQNNIQYLGDNKSNIFLNIS